MIAVMLFAGLRIGEVLGLRWESVDFAGGFIQVQQQLGRDRQLSDLKTDKARRDVILIPQLAKTRREHRMESRHKEPTDFVFPAPDGRGRGQRSATRGVERTLTRAGLDGKGISSHNLRHTFASVLIVKLKLDPVQVSAQLGHSRPTTTMRFYAHLFDKARHADEVPDRLAAGFGSLLAALS